MHCKLPKVLCVIALFAACAGAQTSADGPVVESSDFESASIGGQVRLRVQLPPGYAESKSERYPVIYFLHGMFGNEKKWEARKAPAVVYEMIKEGKLPPVIVACPNGGNSFYLNAKGKEKARYEDMIYKDLIPHMDKAFRTKAEKAGRALLGDSMGGFGALLQALKHPELFAGVASHEGSIFPEDRAKLPLFVVEGRGGRGPGILTSLFGDPVDEKLWLDSNLFHLVKESKDGAYDDLRIYFDVGKEDRYGLAEPSAAWHEALNGRKIKHFFEVREGRHGTDFFNDNLPESLKFLADALRASKTK